MDVFHIGFYHVKNIVCSLFVYCFIVYFTIVILHIYWVLNWYQSRALVKERKGSRVDP